MLKSSPQKRCAEYSNSIYSNKSRCRSSVEARIDPIYGQRSALPGLDDVTNFLGGDEDFDSNDSEIEHMKALSYLSAVRQEAIGIPNILVASNSPSRIIETFPCPDKSASTSSRYEDGAYLSFSNQEYESDRNSEASEYEPANKCFESLLEKYQNLRICLHQKPSSDLLSLLKPHQRTQVGPLNGDLSKWWIWHMKNQDPNPVQVASMDKATVLRLLGLLTQGTVLKSGLKLNSCLSRWTWSLLARLPERGDLTSEEIGVVRGLAKKAMLLANNLRQNCDWCEKSKEDYEFSDAHSEDHDSHSSGIDDETQILNSSSEEEETIESERSLSYTPLDSLTKTQVIKTASTSYSRDCENSVVVCSNQEKAGQFQEVMIDDNLDMSPESTELETAPDDLLSIKRRVFERLCCDNDQESVNFEPEIIPNQTSAEETFCSPERWNSQATIDMILTIVGESYGQRDLLDFRVFWDCDV